MTSSNQADVIVIGAGIAGASVAAELSQKNRVILLEMESQPGYHTTGRSAALFAPSYGPAAIRALTRASAAYFLQPGAHYSAQGLLSPRNILMIARHDQQAALDQLYDEISARTPVRVVGKNGLKDLNPLLRDDYAVAGMLDSGGYDIDVSALHQGYLRRLNGPFSRIITNTQVTGLLKAGDDWVVEAGGNNFRAPILVNAAGAWVDEINGLAGMRSIGLVPKRRTVIVVKSPDTISPSALPATIDIDEKFFVKPETSQLLLSPADETPSPPCDAQPEELDIAIGIDRIEAAFTFPIRKIESSWAGLRSFVSDGVPVAGFSDNAHSFFVLAGQGGYGIQTAPALSRLSTALINGQPWPGDIDDEGVRAEELCPRRLSTE
jgi:D-arginine dehydrogenase